MAKKALLDVLEQTIGKYVKNLDAQSLNVAIWSGKIELHSLELNIDAVNGELDRQAADQPNLAIPFRAIGGTFESLVVDVPWAHLMSRPVVLRARGLNVSVEPYDRLSRADFLQAVVESERKRIEQVQQAREKSIQAEDKNRLRNNEIRKLAQMENNDGGQQASSANSSSFGGRVARRIIENIQIEIENVHVSLKGAESTAGILLGSLSLVTTNARGVRTFVDRTSGPTTFANSFLYKALQITGLGIYMDENDDYDKRGRKNNRLSRNRNQSSSTKLMPIGEADLNETTRNKEQDTRTDEHNYILSPLSFEFRLRKADSTVCVDYAKYKLNSELPALSILLSKTQLEHFREIARTIQASNGARPLFPEYRPLCRVTKGTAGDWWRYAARCIGRINGRRLWLDFFEAFKARKKYVTLYKRAAHHQSCHWLKPLDAQEQAEMAVIEQTRTIAIEGIMFWRNIADGQFEKEKEKHEKTIRERESQHGVATGETKRTTAFASLFRSKKTTTPSTTAPAALQNDTPLEDEAPITLTVEEMKELEDLSTIQEQDSDLSNDSKIYDGRFVLGSFKINLTSRDMRQLVLLEMGEVAASLKVNADGYFHFDLKLFSLQILDRVTPDSLFPAVLSRAQSFRSDDYASEDDYNDEDDDDDSSSGSSNAKDHVFHLHLAKNKHGDRKLKVKLSEFEAVASPLLFVELKRFLSVPQTHLFDSTTKKNPSLEQSLSGSIDLFYDAEEGTTPMAKTASDGTTNNSSTVTDISNKLADAWKKKQEERVSLVLDIDVDAPQLIVPENCVQPDANLLIFDLGRIKFRYGKIEISKIHSWFDKHPRPQSVKLGIMDMLSVDSGKLDIKHLTFVLEKAGNFSKLTATQRRRSSVSNEKLSMVQNGAVIEPINLSLELGVEHQKNSSTATSDKDGGASYAVDRVCVIGVIPAVTLKVSNDQLSQIFVVLKAWTRLLKELRPSYPVEPPSEIPSEPSGRILSATEAEFQLRSPPQKKSEKQPRRPRMDIDAITSPPAKMFKDSIFNILHFSMNLQKLSVTISDEMGSIDANLVSVGVAVSNMSDGSSRSRLSMGYFWILDRFKYDNEIPRKQRLLVHSSLPKPPQEFAIDDKYDILQELEQQGIFEEGFQSSELADITYTKIASDGGKETLIPEELASEDLVCGQEKVSRILSAKFSSLYLHGNPHAIPIILKSLEKFYTILKGTSVSGGSDSNQITIIPEEQSFGNPIAIPASPAPRDGNVAIEEEEAFSSLRSKEPATDGILLAQFEMQSLVLFMNSARDDLELFSTTVANASFNVLMSKIHGEERSDMIVSLALGDVRIKTTDMGMTRREYRTMVGLAPGLSKSLLAVKYYSGPRVMRSSSVKKIDFLNERTSAYVDVELSPMRMVYIQAQVLALVEYINEGIVGHILAMMATAASAAGELAVQVRATAFDFVLPQAAFNSNHFNLHAAGLNVNYTSLPNTDKKIQISLSDVLLQDTNHDHMQDEPIRMFLDVSLPALGVGSKEDYALRLNSTCSSASFRMSKPQFEQLMVTLDDNFVELDLFLRDDGTETSADQRTSEDTNDQHEGSDDSGSNAEPGILSGLTHAGIIAIDIRRRIYADFDISALSLEVCDLNNAQPIARLAAVEAKIKYHSFPDQFKSRSQVHLGNLVCDDVRPKAADRQYQSLITHAREPNTADQGIGGEGMEEPEEIFYVSYESYENGSCNVDLKIGSTRFVLIPDAISEILDFVKAGKKSQYFEELVKIEEGVYSKVIESGMDAIETSLSGESLSVDASKFLATTSLKVSTSKCSIVLVDLGSHIDTDTIPPTPTELVASSSFNLDNSMRQPQTVTSQVTESVVFEGAWNTNLEYASDKRNGEMKSLDLQIQCMGMEAYTAFGRERGSPVQILEPAGFSLAFSILVADDKTRKIDVRAAALSSLDFSFSMGNAALISAIMSSLSECFKDEEFDTNGTGQQPLSKEDAERIEKLASALEIQESNSYKPNESSREILAGGSASIASKEESTDPVHSMFRLNLTLPEAKVTFINDLQGLDEALFRITVKNFVTGGNISSGPDTNTNRPAAPKTSTRFNLHVNTMLLADYFDSSVNLWKMLLTKPWELTWRGTRGEAPSKFKTRRLSTLFDIDSLPCHISFSEQFLVSLAAANRMWSIYSMAISSAVSEVEKRRLQGVQEEPLAEKSAAASAARNWITTLPYALDNHAGVDIQFTRPGSRDKLRDCANGSIKYFRFEPPRGVGFGGLRLYGQDISRKKALKIFIKDGDSESAIEIDHIDAELGQPRRAHELENGRMLITYIAKEGKTIVVHLTSSIEVFNKTSIPFAVSILHRSTRHNVGVCKVRNTPGSKGHVDRRSLVVSKGTLSKSSQNFGIPVDKLSDFVNDWKVNGQSVISLIVSPQLEASSTPDEVAELRGPIQLEPNQAVLEAVAGSNTSCCDVVCRPEGYPIGAGGDGVTYPFVLQAGIKMLLVDNKYLSISVYLEPRAKVTNNMPVALSVSTPMPHTYSATLEETKEGNESVHTLELNDFVEIYTPGPSIAVSMKCSDMPVAGTAIGSMEGNWIDLPLTPDSKFWEPVLCVFPFILKTAGPLSARSRGKGCEFFIAEGTFALSELGFNDDGIRKKGKQKKGRKSGVEKERKPGLEISAAHDTDDERLRSFYVTVCNYAVDHTGDILFEQAGASSPLQKLSGAMAYSTFASPRHQSRITLLPLLSTTPLKLLQMSMDLDEGIRRSMPFCVDDIAICTGGVESTLIKWQDDTPSGYFAYRSLVNTHQSEIHIIPEFVIFNGSESYHLTVRQPGSTEITIAPGKIAPVWVHAAEYGLVVSMEYKCLDCRTAPLQVDSLGLKVAVVKSITEGFPVGSLAIQTVCGAQDSRLVVKVGEINYGSSGVAHQSKSSTFKDDFLRFRIQSSELKLTLNEARKKRDSDKYMLEEFCTLVLKRFTVDWQKVFKIERFTTRTIDPSPLLSPERSQLSVLVHSFKITDNTPNTPYPVVFDTASDRISFVDLCVRCRGQLDADLVKVDLIDLNLNHQNGFSENMTLSTSEQFVWKLIDLAGRISGSSAELASDTLVVKWDEKHGEYAVAAGDSFTSHSEETKYKPPKSDKLYDIHKTRVSPFSLVLSFHRNPEENPNREQSGRGASILNYFIHHLKFKIEKAEMKFARYERRHLKGPPDRLVDELTTVYMSRMKTKIFTIMTAASLNDWKYLAARDDGDDEFVEGDILRVTGNLAGNTLGYVTKKVGRGLGKGISKATGKLGDGIENATDVVGVGVVGAGINSVVTGVGSGVGGAVTGVGAGASKVFIGTGKGIGQVAGGVSGGFLLVGKGIGKGVTQGDAKAVISGVSDGAAAIGSGIGRGVETTFVGATDGVLTVGKGLFSGVKTVGKGIGGAFTGKREKRQSSSKNRDLVER